MQPSHAGCTHQNLRLLCRAPCALQSQARTPQRATADAAVHEHAYIRVHLHPKRFPAAYSVDWKVSAPLMRALLLSACRACRAWACAAA